MKRVLVLATDTSITVPRSIEQVVVVVHNLPNDVDTTVERFRDALYMHDWPNSVIVVRTSMSTVDDASILELIQSRENALEVILPFVAQPFMEDLISIIEEMGLSQKIPLPHWLRSSGRFHEAIDGYTRHAREHFRFRKPKCPARNGRNQLNRRRIA